MANATRRNRSDRPFRGRCLGYVPVVGLAFLSVLAFSLSLTFGDSAAAVRSGDYLTFAGVSNSEKVFNKHDCRKYGGRPVTQGEHDLVMGRGRTDADLYNVLWFGGHQYVTYKIDTSSSVTRLFGIHTQSIWLCQF